uniref:DinG family ATP-dependent helicase YoaA n=1 Tax=Klebsiella pneumoniae TaxID=573 RepID=A0A8B0SRW4_KLEPN|nr:DinG family ATP-dependent helicase YoaA [Klebsiella pneumoniae]
MIATNSHALMHQIFRSDRPLLEQIAEQCGIKSYFFSRLMGESKLRIPGESTWTVTHGRIYRSGYG